MEYPRIDVTVDLALFSFKENGKIQVLLIRRENDPYKGELALPGGYLNPEESLEQAAKRELYEETHTVTDEINYVGVFDDPERDPRGRVISHLFAAFVDEQQPQAGDDATESFWKEYPVEFSLAFDHNDMLTKAFVKLLEAGQISAHLNNLLTTTKLLEAGQIPANNDVNTNKR